MLIAVANIPIDCLTAQIRAVHISPNVLAGFRACHLFLQSTHISLIAPAFVPDLPAVVAMFHLLPRRCLPSPREMLPKGPLFYRTRAIAGLSVC